MSWDLCAVEVDYDSQWMTPKDQLKKRRRHLKKRMKQIVDDVTKLHGNNMKLSASLAEDMERIEQEHGMKIVLNEAEATDIFIGAVGDMTATNTTMTMNFEVCDVKKALAAVWRICKAGNVVQFGPEDLLHHQSRDSATGNTVRPINAEWDDRHLGRRRPMFARDEFRDSVDTDSRVEVGDSLSDMVTTEEDDEHMVVVSDVAYLDPVTCHVCCAGGDFQDVTGLSGEEADDCGDQENATVEQSARQRDGEEVTRARESGDERALKRLVDPRQPSLKKVKEHEKAGARSACRQRARTSTIVRMLPRKEVSSSSVLIIVFQVTNSASNSRCWLAVSVPLEHVLQPQYR